MKIIFILTTVFVLITSAFTQSNPNEEWRSFWVITWEYISKYRTVDENKTRIRQILDYTKSANMNAVLWQVRQSGTAYYPSSYEPWGSYAGGSYPGFDPLAYALEEAHKRGLEFHAWFNVFHASSTVSGAPAAVHPEWVCRDQDNSPMTSSRSLSPGLEAVREYTVNVAMEIVNNYDIDGFHLDYVRWSEYTNSKLSKSFAKQAELKPEMDGFITDELLGDLDRNAAGRYLYDYLHPYSTGVPDSVGGGQFPSWEEWWRYGVTEFVRSLHDSIQAVKPWVRLSPAALGKYRWSGWQGYGTVYQDAALWFNNGYIDQLTPMHYHWTTSDGFYNVLTGTGNENWEYWIEPGINAGRIFTVGPGSYQFEAQNVWENHEEVINTCRTIPWTDGFQFFSYVSWENNQDVSEARRLYFRNPVKVRATKLIYDGIPDTPSLTLNKIDSLTYEIQVLPLDGLDKNQWFAVYRSVDSLVDVTSDDIVDIRFGQEPFILQEKFDGSQPPSDRYYYAATMLDRYWNESNLTEIQVTDSIPYVVPVIDPPLTPDFIRILNNNATSLKVICDTVAKADGYRAYISTDGTIFSDSASSNTNTIIVNNLLENHAYYIRVAAFNDGGKSKLSKRLYAGVPSADAHEILIVNGFDRSTNTRNDYIGFYAGPVNSKGGPFSYTMNETVYEGKVSLQDFTIVIYILGDESTDDITFNPTEQAIVTKFLQGGGKLFVSGAEIGWDLVAKGTTSDKVFYRNYLKASYISDAPLNQNGVHYNCESIPGSIFAGLADFSFDNGTHGTFDVDWPDAIRGIDGSQEILNYKNVAISAGVAGVVYEGMFSGGSEPGKLVYMSVPFETVYPETPRNNIMEKVFLFFDGFLSDVQVADELNAVTHKFELVQNYPNPFNPETTIKFSLQQGGYTKLKIFNTLGQLVRVLVDDDIPVGQHEVRFNASDLASGTYLYVLESGGRRIQRKMILLK